MPIRLRLLTADVQQMIAALEAAIGFISNKATSWSGSVLISGLVQGSRILIRG